MPRRPKLSERDAKNVDAVRWGFRDAAWLRRQLSSEAWRQVEVSGILHDAQTLHADNAPELAACDSCGRSEAVRPPNTICVACQKALRDVYLERSGFKP